VALETRNHGDSTLARQRVTAQLMFGTSVWQLAPQAVSGGKNHGHFALDLAMRTNALLHAAGGLPPDRWLAFGAEASQRLRALWRDGTRQQRETWARYMSNPLSINFGLAELASANVQRLRGRDANPAFEKDRELFLGLY
jgi:hypothetical protein